METNGMSTGTLPRKRKRKESEPIYKFGFESNGTLMSPEEFDDADYEDFDQNWSYELINGVLVVSPIPLVQESDPNEELGRWLRNYQEDHPNGNALDFTLIEQYVKCGQNRRKPDRSIWTGLGRLPRKNEDPSMVIEFVSRRKRDRELDYETKRREYQNAKIQEYWIIDRFQRIMTVHVLEDGKYRIRVVHEKQTYKSPLLPGFELPLAKLLKYADRWAEFEESA
jgi:Uma2 family endonuclease